MNSTLRAAAALVGVLFTLQSVAEPAEQEATGDQIDEIVVTGHELTGRLASVSVDREVVVDTADALSKLPGADRNRNGRLSGIAQYRGMFGDRVSVTIDGIGVISGGPNAMDAPLSYVSPMITERLVLERGLPGVGSAPEAIGGHVEARIARGDFGADDDFDLAGMTGVRHSDNGNYSAVAARLTAANRSHRFSLVGQSERADDQSTPAGDIVPSELSRDRYDLSYAFTSERGDLTVFAGGLETLDTGTPALAMDIRYIDTTLFGLRSRFEATETLTLRADVGYNDVDHVMDNFGLRPAPGSPMQFRQNRTGGSGMVFSLAADYELAGYDLTFGLDGRFATHDSYISNPNNGSFFIRNFEDIHRDVVSGFAAIGNDSGRSAWEFGVRYTDVSSDAGEVAFGGMPGMMQANAAQLADAFNAGERSRSFGDIDAVARYAYSVSDSVGLSIDVGTRSRAPAYQELYLWLPLQATGGLADGRNYIGNLELDSERSIEAVIGVDWSGERFSVTPQIFYRDVEDYIQGIPSNVMPANMIATMMSGAGALQFDNVDAELYGFDVGWRYQLSESLSLDGTAGYTRGRRTDVSDNLYRLAPLNGSIALNYFRSGWLVRTEVVGYDRQDEVSEYNGEQQTAGYGIVNVHAAWQVSSGLRIDLKAENLFDRGYQDHLAGVNRVRDVDIAVGERLYGSGRAVTLGASLTF
ncbi:MAG: TonB-dependent receptor [Woeseiaceae bacterium]|nr:TonB-dependent receptor [Woeseiaceae bacterium]